MRIVIDACVLIKWYVLEIHSPDAELLVNPKFEIHAPEVVIPEFGNVLWQKCRMGELSTDETLKIADEMLKEDITFHDQAMLLRSSVDNANKTGRTVHDWIYMVLALSLGAKFVTADRPFFRSVRETSYKSSIVWVENIASLL